MATIRMRELKNGQVYEFIVKLKDQSGDKYFTKSTRWKPPIAGKSEKQRKLNDREADSRAIEWEKTIKEQYGNINLKDALSPDSTFNECAQAWVKKLADDNASFAHQEDSKDAIHYCYPLIGGIKLKDLSQSKLQNFFDFTFRRERTIRVVRSRPEAVKEAMKKRNESYSTLTKDHGLNVNTVCSVLNGKSNVSYNFAKRVADALNADITALFNIQETVQKFAYNSNRKIMATVRAILSFAKKRRLVVDNYASADYIDYPKRTQKEIQCMDEEQVRRTYQAILDCEDIRYGTALLTLLLTGCRRGELIALKWENIDFENQRITINKSVTRTKNHGVYEKDPKTERSKRAIDIPHLLNERLKEYKLWYMAEKTKMAGIWEDDGYVFVNAETGKRISPDMIIQWINKITEKAGLGHWTVHSMRHTNITMKLMNNVPLLEVSGEAGHSRTSTTMDRYGHFLSTHNKVGPKVLDNIIILPVINNNYGY